VQERAVVYAAGGVIRDRSQQGRGYVRVV